MQGPAPQPPPPQLVDLTLAMLVASSWTERGLPLRRSWKQYPFDVMDLLVDEDLALGSHRSKSLVLTEEGQKRGAEVLRRLGYEALVPGSA